MKKSIFLFVLGLLTTSTCVAQQSDEFTTQSGKKVVITPIKHASMQIQYNGLEIQVDPVGMWLKPETDYATFPKAKIILITHEHKDHFDREAIHALRTPVTSIYVNQAVYGHFKNGIVLHNGDSINYAPDVKIQAVPAYNTTADHLQYHPKGRDNGYVLTLDGLRIYIAGDTENIPEMAQLKDIDIAFLPCNQPYTMTVDQVVEAAKIIRPKVLFPYHYNDTPVHRIAMKLAGEGIRVVVRNYK